MILEVGDTGVDFSFARPPAQRLLDLNYSFIVGYISVYPSSPAKNITHAELDAYEAAGLDTLLVWEMSATRANLGATYGTQDGANARIEALNRDYPEWKPILAADDTNTTATNIDAQEAYMRAFAKACAPYPIGIYGDIDILTRCKDLWVLGWMPNAWAWSGSSRADAEAKARALGVHVLQRKGFYIDNTWAVDPNEVIKDVAFGPPDPPDPGDPEMIDIVTNAESRGGEDPLHAKFAVMDDGTIRPMSGTEIKGRGLTLTLALGVPLSNTELDSMGVYQGITVDMTARAAVAALQGTVASIDTELGETKQNLVKAGGG